MDRARSTCRALAAAAGAAVLVVAAVVAPTAQAAPATSQAASAVAGATACGTVTWVAGVSYRLGDVVRYAPNGQFYEVVNVTAGGTDATDPTISTWYWQPTACAPRPVVAAYYPTFGADLPRLVDIDPAYDLVFLFNATQDPGQSAGTLRFQAPTDVNGAWSNWAKDLQRSRSEQHRRFVLSAGGAGEAIRFTDRAVSQRFVDSVDRLYTAWGGFDGLDFNTFEADAAPNTPEMIWIAEELKRRHPGFLITAPPAPWNQLDQRFCKDMLDAGVLDFCAPQYYDGPQLSDPAYLESNITTWMNLLGPDHVVVGYGVSPSLPDYWSVGSAEQSFRGVKAAYPSVRGVFDWRLDWDARDGYPFARTLAPIVRS